jgi:hypothetical protein
MVKWIIFYVALQGVNEPRVGEILFFEADSVKAFDITWTLVGKDKVITKDAVIFSGIFQLEHQGVKASLTIVSKEVTFIMDGGTMVNFLQRNHQEFLYDDVEELYPIKKKYESTSLVDR